MKAGTVKKGGEWNDEKEQKIKNEITNKFDKESDSKYASARLWDDGIIMPEDTRKVLGMSLMVALKEPVQDTKHGVFRM
jgi:3-methylcrotonyl-CoA carboxylase beta subunit